MKLGRLALVAVVFIAAAGWYYSQPPGMRPAVQQPAPGPHPAYAAAAEGTDVASQQVMSDDLGRAFRSHSSGIEIATEGTVARILTDDRDGSPHQRFIVRTGNGQTVLIAHNIDLAPRLEGLAVGDHVAILGEYEWNAQGGLLHWTHRDPAGRHPTGHIDWKGRRYQ